MKKRVLATIMVMILLSFTGCGKDSTSNRDEKDGDLIESMEDAMTEDGGIKSNNDIGIKVTSHPCSSTDELESDTSFNIEAHKENSDEYRYLEMIFEVPEDNYYIASIPGKMHNHMKIYENSIQDTMHGYCVDYINATEMFTDEESIEKHFATSMQMSFQDKQDIEKIKINGEESLFAYERSSIDSEWGYEILVYQKIGEFIDRGSTEYEYMQINITYTSEDIPSDTSDEYLRECVLKDLEKYTIDYKFTDSDF